MRRYLLIFAALMLAFSSKAHAAACSGGATCVSVQDGGGSGAAVTSVAVAFSPNNTATNTLTAIMYVNCATDWTGSGPAGIDPEDSNSNFWDYSEPEGAQALLKQQTFFMWANNVVAGANTLTVNIIGHTDCTATIKAYEDSGIYPIYNFSDDIVVNSGSAIPTTTFPITIGSGGGSPTSGYLQRAWAVHDTGNTGTFSIDSGWSLTNSFSGSGTTQTAGWDLTSTAPTTVTIGNTGGSGYSVALGGWYSLNKTPPSGPPPPPISPTLMNYNSGKCADLNSGQTSATCTFVNVLNPDVGIIASWGSTSGAGNIASVSGCGVASWPRFYIADFNGNEQDLFVTTYLTPGSSCAVTVTYNAAQTRTSIMQGEYAGVAADPIAFIPAGGGSDVRIPSQVGGATIPFQTYEANDLFVAIGSSYNNCGGLFYSSGGVALTSHNAVRNSYPCPPTPGGGNTALMQVMDATIASAGSHTTTISNNQGSDSYIFPMVLRAVMPTGPAVVQQISASTSGLSVSSISAQALTPWISGQRWIVITESRTGALDVAPTMDLGTCPEALPSDWGNATAGVAWLCNQTSAGRPTFTYGTSNGDMYILGVQNINSVFPLYGGSAWTNVFSANVGPSVSTQANSPLTLPGGQCFLLAGFGGGGTNQLYTASSGFNVRSTWPWNNAVNVQNTWDQQVCPSSQTTYNFVLTSPVAQGGLESGMWAFGNTQNTTWPVVSDATGVQFNGSQVNYTLRNPLVGGESITICGGAQGTLFGISSTPTVTWTLRAGGGSNDYAAWTAQGLPSGNLTITLSYTGSFVDSSILVNRNVGSVDTYNSGYSASGATLNPSLTTSVAADFLNTCATSMGSLTNSFALQNDASWTLNQYVPTDEGYADGWSKLAGVASSYSANMSFESNQPSSLSVIAYLPYSSPPPSINMLYGTGKYYGVGKHQ